jgi:hypothetical protein
MHSRPLAMWTILLPLPTERGDRSGHARVAEEFNLKAVCHNIRGLYWHLEENATQASSRGPGS